MGLASGGLDAVGTCNGLTAGRTGCCVGMAWGGWEGCGGMGISISMT